MPKLLLPWMLKDSKASQVKLRYVINRITLILFYTRQTFIASYDISLSYLLLHRYNIFLH